MWAAAAQTTQPMKLAVHATFLLFTNSPVGDSIQVLHLGIILGLQGLESTGCLFSSSVCIESSTQVSISITKSPSCHNNVYNKPQPLTENLLI